MVSALIGPLYYRRWFSPEPIDDQFVKTIVRNVISGQQAASDPGPGPRT
jgi:hypothetical protein